MRKSLLKWRQLRRGQTNNGSMTQRLAGILLSLRKARMGLLLIKDLACPNSRQPSKEDECQSRSRADRQPSVQSFLPNRRLNS